MSAPLAKPDTSGKVRFLIGFIVLSAALVWLSLPAATDTQRIAFACTLPLAAGWMIWKKRRSFWWPPFIILLLACALILVLLTGPSFPNWFFELFIGRITGFALTAFLCWILVRFILPRTTAKYQAKGILLLSLAFPVGMFIASLAWWYAAVEVNMYAQLPIVRNFGQFAEEHKNRILDYRGLLLTGRVGDPEKANTPPETLGDLVAYYETRLGSYGFGSAALSSWYPQYYTVTLEDGTVVQAQGNNSQLKTHAWPEVPVRIKHHGLKHGDPVVIWGDPHKSSSMSTGEESWTLLNTRMVAYGTPEEFRENFLLPGVRAARAFGWVAFGCMFLALIPLALGLRRYRWLKIHGSDAVPPLPPGSQEAQKSAKQQVLK